MTLPSCSNEGTTIVDEERDQQNHSFQCNNDSNNWIDVLGSDKQNKLSRYDRILTNTIEENTIEDLKKQNQYKGKLCALFVFVLHYTSGFIRHVSTQIFMTGFTLSPRIDCNKHSIRHC